MTVADVAGDFGDSGILCKGRLQQIFAFGSRRVIYPRGAKQNVEKVKDIISLFDRPAPQARLNL